MIRGDNLYASGIVLVTPLEMEVLEEPAGGRVRVTVRDARTKDFVPKVQVKVIGSDNPQFISGETDLRGVFVAEGLRGLVTAVARKGTRSTRSTAARPTSAAQAATGAGSGISSPQAPRPAASAARAIPRRQSQDAEHRQYRQADRATPAAIHSAGRQEQGSGRRRIPLSD